MDFTHQLPVIHREFHPPIRLALVVCPQSLCALVPLTDHRADTGCLSLPSVVSPLSRRGSRVTLQGVIDTLRVLLERAGDSTGTLDGRAHGTAILALGRHLDDVGIVQDDPTESVQHSFHLLSIG